MATDNRQLYLPIVQREAARAGIPWQLLDAMIQQESSYNPTAVGDGGNAIGLGQLWRAASIDAGIDPAQRLDPETNIRGAANYAAIAYRNAGGDWAGTAARYNAGAHRQSVPEGSSAWTHAQNVQRRAQELGHAWAGTAAAAAPYASAATPAPRAQNPWVDLALGGGAPGAGFRGIDYPEPPQLAAPSTATTAQDQAAASRPSRQMSLREILGYGNLRPPGWYPG